MELSRYFTNILYFLSNISQYLWFVLLTSIYWCLLFLYISSLKGFIDKVLDCRIVLQYIDILFDILWTCVQFIWWRHSFQLSVERCTNSFLFIITFFIIILFPLPFPSFVFLDFISFYFTSLNSLSSIHFPQFTSLNSLHFKIILFHTVFLL